MGVSYMSIIALTDKKSVTFFIQTKKLPGNHWNAVDYVLSNNFVLGAYFGKSKCAANHLSQIYVNSDTKLKLKLNDRIPVQEIEIQDFACTLDNFLNFLAPNFLIPKITIEPVENTVDNQVEEITQLKDPSMNKLSEFHPLDSYDLINRVNAIDMSKEPN